MKIIILGAGQVGGTLAENLVDENNDITVVDTNADCLRQLQDQFDLESSMVTAPTHEYSVMRELKMQIC